VLHADVIVAEGLGEGASMRMKGLDVLIGGNLIS